MSVQALFAAAGALHRQRQEFLRGFGLTEGTYDVLCLVYANGGQMSMGSLVEALQVANSTVTPMADRLAEAGWVIQERAKNDRRKVMLELVPEKRGEFEVIAAGVAQLMAPWDQAIAPATGVLKALADQLAS